MLTHFEERRIRAEAAAAAARGETFEASCPYLPHTGEKARLFHRVHQISSRVAAASARPLLSSGASVDPTAPASNVQIP